MRNLLLVAAIFFGLYLWGTWFQVQIQKKVVPWISPRLPVPPHYLMFFAWATMSMVCMPLIIYCAARNDLPLMFIVLIPGQFVGLALYVAEEKERSQTPPLDSQPTQ